ncbi:hypothetical protein Tco_0924762 [Tanacetum coccineum]|uniref:Uncharacterized protein n=1 Tax=Tanacetum coccineum TaxID=301880 RepID=A0ABQ5D5R4_9ASTR
MASQDARLSKFEADFKQQQSEMTNKIDTVLKAITDRMAGALPSDTVKNPKLNVNSTSPVSSARSYPTVDPQCSTQIHGDDGDVMFIEIIKKNDDSHKEEPEVGENEGVGELRVEYFDVFSTRRNFTYVIYFMIVEDISSIINPRPSQVVLGNPFVEISNMTYDPPEGVVRFTNRTDENAYKMPYKLEQYNSLSDLEREDTKSVYLRNEEDKRRAVELYLMRISLEVLRKFHWTILGGRFNQLSHLRMTKVIKGEFEKLEDLNDEYDSLTCGTLLKVFNKEFNRMIGMDDDLFIYEVEVVNIPCDSNKDDDLEQRV